MTYVAVLRTERLRTLCNHYGLTVDDVADHVELDRSTIYRTLRGATAPSAAFIAGCVALFGETYFSDLFRITHADETRREGTTNTFAPVLQRRDTALINTSDSPLAHAARGGDCDDDPR